MNCCDAQLKISKYSDNELSEEQFEETREHIKACPVCKKFYNFSNLTEFAYSNVSYPETKLKFDDLTDRLPNRGYRKISVWAAVACLMFAVIFGAVVGSYSGFELKETDYSDYTGYKVSYVSVYDNYAGENK